MKIKLFDTKEYATLPWTLWKVPNPSCTLAFCWIVSEVYESCCDLMFPKFVHVTKINNLHLQAKTSFHLASSLQSEPRNAARVSAIFLDSFVFDRRQNSRIKVPISARIFHKQSVTPIIYACMIFSLFQCLTAANGGIPLGPSRNVPAPAPAPSLLQISTLAPFVFPTASPEPEPLCELLSELFTPFINLHYWSYLRVTKKLSRSSNFTQLWWYNLSSIIFFSSFQTVISRFFFV